MLREKVAASVPGVLMLIVLVGVFAGAVVMTIAAFGDGRDATGVGLTLVAVTALICVFGLFVVNPNEAKVVQLFGSYIGSVRQPGFHWVNPFTTRKSVSMRVRNFESSKLKVNDHTGNPIEIAAVVVWRVVDSAEAVFEVDDYQHFVTVQSESALRNLATSYAYDAHVESELSLRGNTAEIAT